MQIWSHVPSTSHSLASDNGKNKYQLGHISYMHKLLKYNTHFPQTMNHKMFLLFMILMSYLQITFNLTAYDWLNTPRVIELLLRGSESFLVHTRSECECDVLKRVAYF